MATADEMTIREMIQLFMEEVWLVRGRSLEDQEAFGRDVTPKLERLWPALGEYVSSTDRFHVFLNKIDPERHGDPRHLTNSVIDYFGIA